MKATNGAMGHEEIMNLPWPVYQSYWKSIGHQNETESNLEYFNGSEKLTNIWMQNKDKWSA